MANHCSKHDITVGETQSCWCCDQEKAAAKAAKKPAAAPVAKPVAKPADKPAAEK